jgi:phosphatidylserine/phosphatidylglycerophosphate/cardiolipin synthase-like enzyme
MGYNSGWYTGIQEMKNMKTAYRRILGVGLLILLLISACGTLPTALPAAIPSESPASPDSQAAPGLEVFFTDPDAPSAGDYVGGPDEVLVAALDGARASIDVAIYNLNLWSVRDALLRAQRRGVVVRLVTESDNLENAEVQELIEAGIPVVSDRREGLMHNKFVVIDRSQVWLGSMNFTVGGTYYDANNLLVIRSAAVAEDYSLEFEEMFTEDLFGPSVRAATPNPLVELDGTLVEVYFSPDDGVTARLEALIYEAQESIHFLAFSFTSNELGAAILDQAAAGLLVSGVMDAEQVVSNQGTEYDPFLQAGLDVRLDGLDGLMHHKVLIIDRSIVVTGSFNFTASAEERNDENLVILYSPELAAAFLDEFAMIYQQAAP